jgi:hypothetical protein
MVYTGWAVGPRYRTSQVYALCMAPQCSGRKTLRKGLAGKSGVRAISLTTAKIAAINTDMSKEERLKELGAMTRAAKNKRGRPRIGEPKLPRDEPWKALGMSERTWHRRQAEKRETEK